MAYILVTGGGTLYNMTTAGVATALTLPTGVTIATTRTSRMTVLGRDAVVVNGPSRGLQVDAYRVVRPLMLNAPLQAPTLSVATAGLLTLVTGVTVKYTYAIKDARTLRIVCESDFSPVSATTGAISGKKITVTLVPSTDAQVNLCRLYRTTDGGTTYYHWLDVDTTGAITSAADDTLDASLPTVAATTELGTGPGLVPGTRMSLCVAWKNRLWAVGDGAIDTLRYSGTGIVYGWPATYGVDASPPGADQFGITGLLPRRDLLGVARRNILHKVLQNGNNSDGTPNVEILQEYKGVGVWAPDSVVVENDIAYFLAEDGVYTWSDEGIRCISDDAGVRQWFATGNYFNKTYWSQCFAKYNHQYNGYELHLVSAGGSTFDRFVFYDIKEKRWFGPHKTAAFTSSIAAALLDSSAASIPVIGTTGGFLAVENSTSFTDWASAIVLDVLTKHHDGDSPDIDKLWENGAILSKIQASAGNLQMGHYVGGLGATLTATDTYDMRLDRQRTTQLGGPGRMVQLNFTEDSNNLGCELHGYELNFHELGRR